MIVNREQGTGNREQGTGNREQGMGNGEWGTVKMSDINDFKNLVIWQKGMDIAPRVLFSY
ncbi:MAG: hypothetical protein RLZZ203_1007 [Cyanobacteriota bacterium]